MQSRWLWRALAAPGVIWLTVFFLVALYAVLSVALGNQDTLSQPVPFWNPLHWNTGYLIEVLKNLWNREQFLTVGSLDAVNLRPGVLDSWRRSRDLHVHLDRVDLPFVREPNTDSPLVHAAAKSAAPQHGPIAARRRWSMPKPMRLSFRGGSVPGDYLDSAASTEEIVYVR